MTLQDNTSPPQPGYSTEEILWAVGIWSTILTLAPTVVYMLSTT